MIEYGKFSGEEFREKFLKPALEEYDEVVVDMNGAIGFPASFLDEAFGVLSGQIGIETLRKKLKIILDDNKVALSEIEECMTAHA